MRHAATSREIRRRTGEGPGGRAARPPGLDPTGRRARRQSGLIAVVALTAATIAPLSTAIRTRSGVTPAAATPATRIVAHARIGSIAPATSIALAAATPGVPPATAAGVPPAATAAAVGAPTRRATLVAGSTGAGPAGPASAATPGGRAPASAGTAGATGRGPRAPGRPRVRRGIRLRIAAPEHHQGQRQRRGQQSAMNERSSHGYVLLRDR